MTAADLQRRQFILDNTGIVVPPHVPEIRLHLAHEAHALWHRTEEELAEMGLPPPYWAFAWAGGQGLARHILDNPEIVAGKRVLDLATGCGIVAIAAAMAGARTVHACDCDSFCAEAVTVNAALNEVELIFDFADLREDAPAADGYDAVFAGDIFYERDLVEPAMALFRNYETAGCDVLIGDPGRSYMPAEGFEAIAQYEVPVTRELEDSAVKRTTVWKLLPRADIRA